MKPPGTDADHGTIAPPAFRRGLVRLQSQSCSAALAVIGITLIGAWAVFELSSAVGVASNVFYLPIVVAAVRFGAPGGLAVATISTLLAGPVGSLGAAAGGSLAGASWGHWVTQGVFFLAIALLVALLVATTRDMAGREVVLADERAALAEQRSRLIQTVSHEFRTPLTIIHGVTETLQTHHQAVEARFQPLVASLARASGRLDELVSVVLVTADAVSGAVEAEQRPCELRAMMREIGDSLGGSARLQIEVADDAAVIMAVDSYLRGLLRCLVDNALKFSPPSEPVTVSAGHLSGRVRIQIRDRGPGISDDFIGAALDLFTQEDDSTKRAHSGLGLGLFAAARLAERLGGRVELDRPSDGGLLATVELPQRRESDPLLQPRGDGAALARVPRIVQDAVTGRSQRTV